MSASVVQPSCFCTRDHSTLYAAFLGSVTHEAMAPAIETLRSLTDAMPTPRQMASSAAARARETPIP